MSDVVKREIAFTGKKFNEVKLNFAKEMAADFLQNEAVANTITDFFDLLMDLLNENEDKQTVMDRAVVYGRNIGALALKHGNKLDESINRISRIRRAMWEELKSIMLEEQVTLESALGVADQFDPLFDKVIYAFSIAYINSYKESLERAEEEFLKLSAPIVTVMENVAVLPIIGGMNEKRAGLLMDKALKEATERDLNKLFIDLSGVTLIDTLVAYYLYKIIQSLKLVGVTTVLTGIRPEVTQTMVSMGVDFSEVKKYGSLNQALTKHMHYEP